MLSARNVSYTIGNLTLVRHINLTLTSGEIVALIGANGAGKTTLLRLLSRELTPTSGEIYLHNKLLNSYKMRELALQRSVMRQHIYMNFDFTAYEIVMMGRHPHIQRGETQKDREIVSSMLKRTETDHLIEQLYATLSSGEKARVTLARVLAQQTPILLLDEPTSAMDLRHQQLTMRLMREFADSGGTVLAVLHDLNLAAMYADRIGMMHRGELLNVGKPQEVLTPENINAIFDIPVQVMKHPRQDCPMVVPLIS